MTEAEATRLAEEEGLSLMLAPGTTRAEATKANSDVGSGSAAITLECPACPPHHRHCAHICGRTKKSVTHTKTGYKGVAYHSDSSKFSAHIQQGGTRRCIGSFTSAAEAALAYARAAATAPAVQPRSVSKVAAATKGEAEAPQQPAQQPHILGKRVPKRKRVFESFESADPPEAPQLPLRQKEVVAPGPPRPVRCTIETPCEACCGSANKATA